MGFLETCGALLAFVTLGGAVGYFSSGGSSPPDEDTAYDLTNIAHAQYAKPLHLTKFKITDED